MKTRNWTGWRIICNFVSLAKLGCASVNLPKVSTLIVWVQVTKNIAHSHCDSAAAYNSDDNSLPAQDNKTACPGSLIVIPFCLNYLPRLHSTTELLPVHRPPTKIPSTMRLQKAMISSWLNSYDKHIEAPFYFTSHLTQFHDISGVADETLTEPYKKCG